MSFKNAIISVTSKKKLLKIIMKKYFVAPLAICVIASQLTPLQVFARTPPPVEGRESCRRPVMVARRSIALKQVTAAQTLDNRVTQRDVQNAKAENFSKYGKSIRGGGGGIIGCGACSIFGSCPRFCFQNTAENEQYAKFIRLEALSIAKRYDQPTAPAPLLTAIAELRTAVNAASSTRTAAITSLRATLFNGYDTGLVDRLDDINALKTTRLNAVNNAYTAWQARCANPSVPSEDPSFVSSVAYAKSQYDNSVSDVRGTHLSSMQSAFNAYMLDINEELEAYDNIIKIAAERMICVSRTVNMEGGDVSRCYEEWGER